jgi:PAS domain S-box-containing protein
VERDQRELLTLEMVRELASVEESLRRFIARLIGGSVLLVLILGSALWHTLRRYALLPLEREVAVRREEERKFRKLLESAPDAMVYVNQEGRIALVNEQTGKLFGYAPGELAGKEIEVLVPERFRAKHREHRKAYALAPTARLMGAGINLYGVTKDGREFPADISLSPVETSEGLFVLADIRDISERKRAEEEIKRGYYYQTTISSILRISLERLSLEDQMDRILDTILLLPFLSARSMGSIYLVEDDPELLVMKVQRGLPESVRTGCGRVSFGKCLCGMSAATREVVFADSAGQSAQFHDKDPHGHYCVPIVSGDRVLGVLNVYVEKDHAGSREEEELLTAVAKTLAGIIERRKAEQERETLRERLNLAEKLSALGRLTANVAHEIRNPLTSLGGFARRLEKKLPPESKERKYVGIIVSEVARLEKILRSVLTFSRGGGVTPRPEDVNALLDEALASFELLSRERSVRIERAYGALPQVMLDRDKFREVLQNLFSNAMDAMPKGGALTVVTKAEVVHEAPLLSVRISDTGRGIPEDQLRLIFEPFFTTKVLEQGTGLGLAISKKIVEDHGGSIGVESVVGRGTTFVIFLPLKTTAKLEAREGVLAGSGRRRE